MIWGFRTEQCKGDGIAEMKAEEIWRRGRDSNPRARYQATRFPSVLLQPLGHLSVRLEPAVCGHTGNRASATPVLSLLSLAKVGAGDNESGAWARIAQGQTIVFAIQHVCSGSYDSTLSGSIAMLTSRMRGGPSSAWSESDRRVRIGPLRSG